MKIDYSKAFDRQFARLSKHQKNLVRGAVELYIDDPFNQALRNHPLKGDWRGFYSISADEDLRIHFKIINAETALLVAVGSHKQLYK